jgi:hypothetical protein
LGAGGTDCAGAADEKNFHVLKFNRAMRLTQKGLKCR